MKRVTVIVTTQNGKRVRVVYNYQYGPVSREEANCRAIAEVRSMFARTGHTDYIYTIKRY